MSTNITVMPSKAVTVATIRQAGRLPADVASAIREVLVAFPSANVGTEERSLQLGTYRDAVIEFEPELVIFELKHLRLHNPRNTPTYTQPPTAQDVYEACSRRRRSWAALAYGHFIGDEVYSASASSWQRKQADLPCSKELALKLLVENFDRKKAWSKLLLMPQAEFDALPEVLFGDDDESREAASEQRVWKAYMRSLTDNEWQMRRAVLLEDRKQRSNDVDVGPDLNEADLMLRAKALVEEYQTSLKKTVYPALTDKDEDFVMESEWGHINDFLRSKGMHYPGETIGYPLYSNNLRCVPYDELGGKRRKRASVNVEIDGLINAVTEKLTGGAP